jgi:hypothetical protein
MGRIQEHTRQRFLASSTRQCAFKCQAHALQEIKRIPVKAVHSREAELHGRFSRVSKRAQYIVRVYTSIALNKITQSISHVEDL